MLSHRQTYDLIFVFSCIIYVIFVSCINIETSPSILTANQTQLEEEPHIGKLDIRVGKIIGIEKHPNAELSYVAKVDVGDQELRTIICPFVKFIPIEDMLDRDTLFIVNSKPHHSSEVYSEGMIMYACGHNKVEILTPPRTAQPGDPVEVEGYERKPDSLIDDKEETYRVIQRNLKTNEKKEATYKGIPWNVAGKGPVTTQSLIDVSIR